MMVASLVAVVAHCTGKIIKNSLSVFENGENFLQNDVIHFLFKLSQLSEIVTKLIKQTKN